MAIIFEKFDSRETTVGPENPSVDLLYGVLGTESDLEVKLIVEATIPAFYAGLVLQHYRIQHLSGGIWDVTVHYARKEPKETGQSFVQFRHLGRHAKNYAESSNNRTVCRARETDAEFPRRYQRQRRQR